jgi:hypothetical protein
MDPTDLYPARCPSVDVRFSSLSPLCFGGSRGEHGSEEKLGYGILHASRQRPQRRMTEW